MYIIPKNHSWYTLYVSITILFLLNCVLLLFGLQRWLSYRHSFGFILTHYTCPFVLDFGQFLQQENWAKNRLCYFSDRNNLPKKREKETNEKSITFDMLRCAASAIGDKNRKDCGCVVDGCRLLSAFNSSATHTWFSLYSSKNQDI